MSNSNSGIELPHFQFYELDVMLEQTEQPNSTNPNFFDESNRKIELKFELMETEREANVMRAEKRFVQLPKDADSGKKWMMVVDTRIENLRHIIFLRSVVNVILFNIF